MWHRVETSATAHLELALQFRIQCVARPRCDCYLSAGPPSSLSVNYVLSLVHHGINSYTRKKRTRIIYYSLPYVTGSLLSLPSGSPLTTRGKISSDLLVDHFFYVLKLISSTWMHEDD